MATSVGVGGAVYGAARPGLRHAVKAHEASREIAQVSRRGPYPLFDRFPSLEKKIPRHPFVGEFTAVEPLAALEQLLYFEGGQTAPKKPQLFVKRDDISGSQLGGNKARKLEFLVAEALRKRATTLVTVGMWGSNHALATTLAAKAAGLKTKLLLGPQPVTGDVRQKLLAEHALGAEQVYYGGRVALGLAMVAAMTEAQLPGTTNYYIPPGGSNERGALGYANAFLELAQQLGNEGLPDAIVVPLGSMGTAAGLLVGSCLAGAFGKSRIEGVLVADPMFTGDSATRGEAWKLDAFLRFRMSREDRDRFPHCDYGSKAAFKLIPDYYEPGYGAARPNVFEGMKLVERTEHLTLDRTYSGKAMRYLLDRQAASIRDGSAQKGEKVMFWLTYNSHDLNEIIDAYPWKDSTKKHHELPPGFWPLFDGKVPEH